MTNYKKGAYEEENPSSPFKKPSSLKKPFEFFKMPETEDQILDTLIDYEEENLENEFSNTEENEEKEDLLMLDTEIEIEEVEDYVYAGFNEKDGVSKLKQESLKKIKRLLGYL